MFVPPYFIITIHIQVNKLIDQWERIRNSIKNNTLSKPPPQLLDYMYFQHLSLSIYIGRYMCVWNTEVCCKSSGLVFFSKFLLWKKFITIDSNGNNTLCGLKYCFIFTSILSLKEAAVTCKLIDQSASCMQWVVLTLHQKLRDRYAVYYKVIYMLFLYIYTTL